MKRGNRMDKMDQYVICQDTMALLPCNGPDGSLGTLVVEEERRLMVAQSPLQIVEDSCNYFGSTYVGRKKGAVSMGYKSMPPICVCSELGIYFFPLMSETRRACVWLSHTHVRHWEQAGRKNARIFLLNGQMFDVPVQANIVANKARRAAQYRYQLCERVAPYRLKYAPAVLREKWHSSEVMINDGGTYSIDSGVPGE